MTEVPEHLLRRSRERREALGLAGGSPPDGGGDQPAPETPASPAPAPATAPAPAAQPPAAAAPAAPPAVPDEPAPSYIAPQGPTHTRIPVWVMPVLVALPFWGILYVGAFGEREKKERLTGVALGAQVYRAQGCSSCHGATGEGGSGPALANGQSVLTFPNEEDHANWVRTGSAPMRGQPYGDPDRPGGQRGPATGGMPGFSLSDEEIRAVVQYEREEL